MLASTTVSQLLAGWARLYGHTPVSATVTYLHLVGILMGGGVAVAADRASLRLSPETLPDWRTELDRLAAVHRWVVGGLALIFASGDRKSTRLNSSHRCISYAVFCLKKKIIILSVDGWFGSVS